MGMRGEEANGWADDDNGVHPPVRADQRAVMRAAGPSAPWTFAHPRRPQASSAVPHVGRGPASSDDGGGQRRGGTHVMSEVDGWRGRKRGNWGGCQAAGPKGQFWSRIGHPPEMGKDPERDMELRSETDRGVTGWNCGRRLYERIEQSVLAQPPALPLVLPDIHYYPDAASYSSDTAPQYHIAPSSDPHLLHNPGARPRAAYLIHQDLSSLVIPDDPKHHDSAHNSLDPLDAQEDRERRERERREEYEREDSVDRRTLSHSPNLLPHNSSSPNTATLSPPLSSPASAHSQSYSVHPNYDHRQQSYFDDDTAGHNGTSTMYNAHHMAPHNRATQPPTLPSIFTGLNHQHGHLQSVAPGPYSASPLSSPTEPDYQSSSGARSAYARYNFPPLPAGAGIDRRMSEPAIRSMYHQSAAAANQMQSAVGHLPAANANTYSPSSSSIGYGHERISSGSSSGGGPAGWMNLKIDDTSGRGDMNGPFYGRHQDDSVEHIDLKPISPTQGRDEEEDTDDEDGKDEHDGERRDGYGDRKDKKTYSFVSLPGNAVKKRPRRRYDEIERLYQCNFPNCTKAYGTLNHLNAHVTMQKHGTKRSPGEFKELRKQWRQAKKEAEEADRQRERHELARAQAVAHAHAHAHHTAHHGLAHPSHPHLSPHHPQHAPHHLSQLHHISPTQSHHLPNSYGHSVLGHVASVPISIQHQQQMNQQQLLMNRHAITAADGEFLPSHQSPDGYNGMSQSLQYPSPAPYLREGAYPRSAPSDTFSTRLGGEYRDGYATYGNGRSPPALYGTSGVIRGQRRRVSTIHSPYPDPHGSGYGYGSVEQQPPRYNNGTSNEDASADQLVDMYRSQTQTHRSNDTPTHPSQLTGPGWPPHQSQSSGHTPQQQHIPSSHHTPEHVHQQDDEPLLTSHVSLGSNRLPPDSTLLTPLPGYEPDAEHSAAWNTGSGDF
ncbi:hypothetical protein BXZ70DRAFT_905239 [Cristinia sonorae]|uniref:C2H2-type domain-containing protein n=1 Tax=Cristinia sonorae TaxID=1940300 RepID=A0A8K0UUA3_9AGAR|nr:hypothetical protein BXZ70DRAFT_905239 [Cristinia sonorae]